MHVSRYFIVALFAFLETTYSLESAPVVSSEVFQVTLGTRAEQKSNFPASDNIRYIAEATNGDIVVAGHGASYYSDTGERTKLMLARVDAGGNIKWKRIYPELANQNILAFATIRDRQYIALSEYIRDLSGNLQTTQRTTLRSVDRDGNVSGEIGRLDSVNIRGTALMVDDDHAAFVFAGSDGKNLATRPYRERRDVELYEMDLRGNVRMRPFPKRVKWLDFFQYIGNGEFIYMLTDWRTNMPPTIQRVDGHGDITNLIECADPQCPMSDVVANDERIFTVYGGIAIREIVAYTHDGDEVWRHQVGSEERIETLTPLRSGGLIFSSNHEGGPTITSLNRYGEIDWESRLKSAMQSTSVLGIKELRNDWIALAGTTGPGGAGFVSQDSDGMLLVTDPLGSGLTRYQGCLADATEIKRLQQKLLDNVGIEVWRYEVGRLDIPRSDKVLPIDAKVANTIDCGLLSEHDLRDFLEGLAEETEKLGLTNPSGRTNVIVNLSVPGSIPYGTFWTFTQQAARQVPTLHVAPGSEADTVQYIADEILFYSERTQTVTDRLRNIATLSIEPDRVSMQRFGVLPFGEMIEFSEAFLGRYDALTLADQNLFTSLYAWKNVVFSADNDELQMWFNTSIHVGRDRLEDLFHYLLRTLPALKAEIQDEEFVIKDLLGISLRKDSALDHKTYLDALRKILLSGGALSDELRSKVRQIETFVVIGDYFGDDMQIQDSNRYVIARPAAAGRILETVLENYDTLMSQPKQ